MVAAEESTAKSWCKADDLDVPVLLSDGNRRAAMLSRLMKFFYFLQILREVPLGYRFTLYAYEPFDSAVLGDLGAAEVFDLVKVSAASHPLGYGYKIESRIDTDRAFALGGDLVKKHKDDLDWVIRQFGKKSIADLELESTIVYVAQSACAKQWPSADVPSCITRSVSAVKPRFSVESVASRITQLKQGGIEI